MERRIYYGEIACEATKRNGTPCSNHAYYIGAKGYLCGVHAGSGRKLLPKNPQAAAVRGRALADHARAVEEAAADNRRADRPGRVVCQKMRMMRNPELIPGTLNVFPNFRHENRADGLGLSALSPMKIGPINHGQPGLPPARNLENFHQGNKVYSGEVDEAGAPSQVFRDAQRRMYEDAVPHRHKRVAGDSNRLLYSVWRTRDGAEHRITYIESRQFYCTFYEGALLGGNAPAAEAFARLTEMVRKGYNLCICGYDAFQPSTALDTHYLDPTRPFGHELVLYSMLTLTADYYPWRRAANPAYWPN